MALALTSVSTKGHTYPIQTNVLSSTIEQNSAQQGGGAANFSGARLIIQASTLYSNVATSGAGGGLYNVDAASVVKLVNSTVVSNSASDFGGGIANFTSQVQLFKLQHNDTLPDLVTNQWTQLMSKTNVTGAVDATAAGIYGPYLESVPKNPLNNLSAVTAAASATTGWTYDVTTGNIGATNQTPTAAFDESTGAVN